MLAAGIVGATGAAHAAFPGFEEIYFNDFSGGAGPGWTASAANVFPSTLPLSTPPSGYQGQFLGEFGGNDSLTLTVALPAQYAGTPLQVFLAFDAYFIRSWDGNDTTIVNQVPLGPDRFIVTAGGVAAPLLDATFSIGTRAGQDQSYCPFSPTPACEPTWGATAKSSPPPNAQVALGYHYQISSTGAGTTDIPMDMVYSFGRPASPGFPFAFSGSTLTLTFASANLQLRPDLAATLGVLADESWGLDNVRIEVMAVPEPGTSALIGAGLLVVLGIARRRRGRARG